MSYSRRETSIWSGNLPDVEKAFTALTIWGEDISSTTTIKAEFKINGAAAWTTLGTFNTTAALQTKYFHGITTPETNAVGQFIQLRFTFTTPDTATAPPKLYSFALHSTLRPERLRTWVIDIELGNETLLDNGMLDPDCFVAAMSRLDTLEQQVYPIIMLHSFDEGPEEEVTCHLFDIEKIKQEENYTIVRLSLQEVKTAA